MDSRLFLPGWGAPASLYAPSLPASWLALEPPSFADSGGSLAGYRRWLDRELRGRGRSRLAGHSMGARWRSSPPPSRRSGGGLVLIAPAGLPLDKPIRASARDFLRQLADGDYRGASPARPRSPSPRSPRGALGRAPRAPARPAPRMRPHPPLGIRRPSSLHQRHARHHGGAPGRSPSSSAPATRSSTSAAATCGCRRRRRFASVVGAASPPAKISRSGARIASLGSTPIPGSKSRWRMRARPARTLHGRHDGSSQRPNPLEARPHSR